MRNAFVLFLGVVVSLSFFGCASEMSSSGDGVGGVKGLGKDDSSIEAKVLDFEFESELVAPDIDDVEARVEQQLLYTVGQLNGRTSVGKLQQLQILDSNVSEEGGKKVLHYRARLPVAWNVHNESIDSYTLLLPRDVSSEGLSAFYSAHSESCMEAGAHGPSSGTFWYYYRPEDTGCVLGNDVLRVNAKATVSPVNTTGKFPEYHKVWEDGALRVVAIFVKDSSGATENSDVGVTAYNSFVGQVNTWLSKYEAKTTPETFDPKPGVSAPKISFDATIDATHSVSVTVFLVDSIQSVDDEFDTAYNALTEHADLIAYNGHAGLGKNVATFATKGSFVAGQYQVVMINGCDSLAYTDSTLAMRHAMVNPDDTNGTKYLDFLTNGMPAFFTSLPTDMMALVMGLASYDEPRTFEQIFAKFDPSQVVLVQGEQDNEFVPGFDGSSPAPAPAAWNGLDESFSVEGSDEARYETPPLEAGRYAFELDGSGDGDLYLRVGEAPTPTLYDCRPYRAGSRETCLVDIASPATVHVMIRAYGEGSADVRLVGRGQ